jgi:RimJ/RimL family protein N-acetyltransferase
MKIIKYGITLIRLCEEDLELVRQWRNSPRIQQTMEYREHISKEMQLEWFHKVNNNNNYYFVIEYECQKIGLINGKDIDWEKQQLEGGVFFWDEKYYSTFVPAMASLILTELCFTLFNWKVAYARILKTNTQAIQYNLALGYELCEGQEDVENQLYRLSSERFEKQTALLRKAIARMSDDPDGNCKAHFVFEEKDYSSGLGQEMESILQRMTVVPEVMKVGKEKHYFF